MGAQAAAALGCCGVSLRRLHPHQNPGSGDLPGEDRPQPRPEPCALPLTLASPPRLLSHRRLVNQDVVFRAELG